MQMFISVWYFTCAHSHRRTHGHAHTHRHTHTRTRVHRHTHGHTHTHRRTLTDAHTDTRAHTHTRTHALTHLRTKCLHFTFTGTTYYARSYYVVEVKRCVLNMSGTWIYGSTGVYLMPASDSDSSDSYSSCTEWGISGIPYRFRDTRAAVNSSNVNQL